MYLLSSVEFLCLTWRNDVVWFLYLVLKSFSASLMYVSVVLLSFRVTVAWLITDDCRKFPSSGHAYFCRQLHVLLLETLSNHWRRPGRGGVCRDGDWVEASTIWRVNSS